jgi:hypothetical protein
VGFHKPSLPPVPEDAVDRAAWRVAARRVVAEKRKEKKDAKKAQARDRMRARDALERLRRRQERDGLPRESLPETPDDDDDDDDDDEDDDMAARLGLSPDLRLGQGSSSQPPSGLAPPVSGARTSGSRSEEQGQAEGVLDPLAEGVDPRVAVAAPGQFIPLVPQAPEARMVPKPAAGLTLVVPAGTKARGASPPA